METNRSSPIENNEPARTGSDSDDPIQEGAQFPELSDYKEVPVSRAELFGQHNYKNPGSEFHRSYDADLANKPGVAQDTPAQDQDRSRRSLTQEKSITQEVVLPEQVEELTCRARA